VKYCDEYVCLYVCLSIRLTQKPRGQTSPNFLCMLTVAMAGTSDGISIRHIPPDDVIFSYHGTNDQNHGRCYVWKKFATWRYGTTAVGRLQCLVEFVRMHHRAKSAIYDCLVCIWQVSTLSEVTRHTPSVVVTDDESLDSLVVVDVVQTASAPGLLAPLHIHSLLCPSFFLCFGITCAGLQCFDAVDWAAGRASSL